MNIGFATIKELLALLKKGEISQEEVLDLYLERFKKFDGKIGSAIEVFDKKSISNDICPKGRLKGIPGIIKDNISQKNRGLSCASKILDGFVTPYDATVIERLKVAGGALIGRANLDEFAMGSSTEKSAFHCTNNPWDTSRVAGGSSGGSVAAVSGGLVPWALGSDTGGSVRQPAAYCGIVGIKPTYGLVSRYGLVAHASSLDQIGVATRTVYDNAFVLSIIAGHDMKDSSSLLAERKDYTQRLDGKLPDSLRIGVVGNVLNDDAMHPDVRDSIEESIKTFEKLGAVVKRVSLPVLDYSTAAYLILSRAEAASNLARFDGVRYGLRSKSAKNLYDMYCETRHDGFGKEVQCRIMVGNYVLSAGHSGEFYANAKAVQRLVRRGFRDTFQDVDLLIMPSQAAPAFKLHEYDDDPFQMELEGRFTVSINMAGVPAMSVPCGFTKSGLPVGFQIVGPHLSEGLIYRAAHAYEVNTPWHTKYPKAFE